MKLFSFSVFPKGRCFSWSQRSDFDNALKDACAAARERVVEQTAKQILFQCQQIVFRLLPKALELIEEVLTNENAKPRDRLRACEIAGKWAGLNQPQQQQPNLEPEKNLVDYLDYLASKDNSTN